MRFSVRTHRDRAPLLGNQVYSYRSGQVFRCCCRRHRAPGTLEKATTHPLHWGVAHGSQMPYPWGTDPSAFTCKRAASSSSMRTRARSEARWHSASACLALA